MGEFDFLFGGEFADALEDQYPEDRPDPVPADGHQGYLFGIGGAEALDGATLSPDPPNHRSNNHIPTPLPSSLNQASDLSDIPAFLTNEHAAPFSAWRGAGRRYSNSNSDSQGTVTQQDFVGAGIQGGNNHRPSFEWPYPRQNQQNNVEARFEAGPSTHTTTDTTTSYESSFFDQDQAFNSDAEDGAPRADTLPTTSAPNSTNIPGPRYACRYSDCPMVFNLPSARTKHEKIHWPDHKKPFECPICHKRDHDSRDHKRHVESHGDPQYLCNLCGSVLSRPDNVRRHQRSRNCRPGSAKSRSTSSRGGSNASSAAVFHRRANSIRGQAVPPAVPPTPMNRTRDTLGVPNNDQRRDLQSPAALLTSPSLVTARLNTPGSNQRNSARVPSYMRPASNDRRAPSPSMSANFDNMGSNHPNLGHAPSYSPPPSNPFHACRAFQPTTTPLTPSFPARAPASLAMGMQRSVSHMPTATPFSPAFNTGHPPAPAFPRDFDINIDPRLRRFSKIQNSEQVGHCLGQESATSLFRRLGPARETQRVPSRGDMQSQQPILSGDLHCHQPMSSVDLHCHQPISPGEETTFQSSLLRGESFQRPHVMPREQVRQHLQPQTPTYHPFDTQEHAAMFTRDPVNVQRPTMPAPPPVRMSPTNFQPRPHSVDEQTARDMQFGSYPQSSTRRSPASHDGRQYYH